MLDSSRNAYVAGDVEFAKTFPTTPGAYQRNIPGEGLFLTKFSFGDPFCSFKAEVQVDARPGSGQGFTLESTFALGSSVPLNVATTPLTISVGGVSLAIPAGSLVKDGTGYRFNGVVSGAQVVVVLKEIGSGSGTRPGQPTQPAGCATPGYTLYAVGQGGLLDTVTNPVRVTVSFGDQTGSAETTAEILRKP